MKAEEVEPNRTEPKYFSQFLGAFSATLFLLSAVVAFGWNSPSLPKLFSSDSPVVITADESSWIVSLMKIGGIVAPFAAAWMMDRFGRKATLLAGSVPLILGWILIGFAESVAVIYVARILSGFAYGIGYAVTPMYLGEIATDNIRGTISTLVTVMAKLGILYAFSIGPYVSVRTMAWLALVPVCLFLLTFSWQPETPYYYLGKNRKDEAFKSLARLRGIQNVEEELNRMEVAVNKSKENKGTFKELFFKKGNRNGLIIIIGLSSIQHLCGSQAIIAYAEIIFDKVGSDLRGSEATIVLGVIQLVSAAISSTIVDTVGRRPLLLLSVVGVSICNTIVAVYFNLERNGADVNGIAWLPLVAIMVFIVCYTIGMATVTFAILSEIFPKNLKAVGGAAYAINGGIWGFVITKLFQVVSDGLGTDYTFFGFALFSYLFIPFIWFLVPETKGKSLDLILVEMNEPNKK